MTQSYLTFYQPEADKKKSLKEAFNLFWSIWPKGHKVGKDYAERCFKKAFKKIELTKMLASIDKQKTSEQWTKSSGEFIPNPSTWLNQGRWDDELTYKESLSDMHARLVEKGEL